MLYYVLLIVVSDIFYYLLLSLLSLLYKTIHYFEFKAFNFIKSTSYMEEITQLKKKTTIIF